MKCDLCEIPEEDYIELCSTWFTVICKTCKIPMVVLRRHSHTLFLYELIELAYFLEVCYPEYDIRTQARQILDHVHFHLLEVS
jgi:hypothetical protein